MMMKKKYFKSITKYLTVSTIFCLRSHIVICYPIIITRIHGDRRALSYVNTRNILQRLSCGMPYLQNEIPCYVNGLPQLFVGKHEFLYCASSLYYLRQCQPIRIWDISESNDMIDLHLIYRDSLSGTHGGTSKQQVEAHQTAKTNYSTTYNIPHAAHSGGPLT